MDIELLIKEIHSRPSLWNQKDCNHHNRYVLDKQWEEVAKKLNTTRDVVRSRWKTLRDGFRKEYKKYIGYWQGGPSSTPTWSYFESLMFLKDHMFIRPPSHMLPRVENIDENSENPEDSGSASPSSTHLSAKRFKPSEPSEEVTIGFDAARPKLDDDDSSFFESLLPHVRKLPPQKKLLLRLKVQELLYEFSYGEVPYESHQTLSVHFSEKPIDITNDDKFNFDT